MKSIANTLGDGLTEVIKGAASGALTGAIDAGVKVAEGGNKTKTKVADDVKKSNSSVSRNKPATNKKTKSGK